MVSPKINIPPRTDVAMPRTMLSDNAWEKLKQILKSSGRVYNKYEHRNTLEGILYRMRTGIPWRDLPKEFGEYRGEKIFEIEKCCVATNTMNFESYLNCRNYSFIVHLIGHAVFRPVYKLTEKIGISWYNFSKQVTNAIQDKNFKGKFKDVYNEFCKESLNELFDSEQEAIEFYSKPKN